MRGPAFPVGVARSVPFRLDESREFEEFGQIENPLQARAKGTGLGLPLARKLAELLGGSVSVRSEPGVGSTFSVIIPRVKDDYSGQSGICLGSKT